MGTPLYVKVHLSNLGESLGSFSAFSRLRWTNDLPTNATISLALGAWPVTSSVCGRGPVHIAGPGDCRRTIGRVGGCGVHGGGGGGLSTCPASQPERYAHRIVADLRQLIEDLIFEPAWRDFNLDRQRATWWWARLLLGSRYREHVVEIEARGRRVVDDVCAD